MTKQQFSLRLIMFLFYFFGCSFLNVLNVDLEFLTFSIIGVSFWSFWMKSKILIYSFILEGHWLLPSNFYNTLITETLYLLLCTLSPNFCASFYFLFDFSNFFFVNFFNGSSIAGILFNKVLQKELAVKILTSSFFFQKYFQFVLSTLFSGWFLR